MEILLIVIENLKSKKKRLMSEKENNQEKIKECEAKIAHYKYLYSYFSWMKKAKEKNMETYSKISEFSSEHKSLFDFLGNSNSDYAEKQISKCKREINSCNNWRLEFLKWLKYFLKRLDTLESRNKEIEEKIEEIDAEILRLSEEYLHTDDNDNEPKKYILERGENDD